jgi:hypothetical protein
LSVNTRRLWLILTLVGVIGGCGDEQSPTVPSSAAVEDGGVQHIHGLGVNPADESLMIATHTGLFRAGAEETEATRVGDRRQDTMGFTVVGPDRFLGSGHPDARDELPPLLGLIRSDDAGRSWDSVSLLGEADFHVLRASGRRIYGFDATNARLLTSDDAGRSWERRTPPAAVFDLTIDPADPARVVASTEAGVFLSVDAGRTWRPLARDRAGLLAWTRSALVLVEGSGAVNASPSPGRRFERVGQIGGQPAALAADGDDLYVALHTNEVKRSSDSGRSWSVRVAP